MLKDKLVLVTGASAGIGRACAEAFAREGCRLILSSRRTEKLEAAAASLDAPYHLMPLDVRDRDAVNRAVTGLPAEWRDIDILVNNAGLSRGLEKVQDALPSDWEEMIDTNVKGLLWVTQAVLPGMIERDRGHVVNIGSIAGHQVYTGGSVYCATKHAVGAITQGLRLDLLGTRVRVSSVDPGMVETDFSLVRFHGDQDRADKVYRQFPPLKAADIADCVLFCASRPEHVAVMDMLVMPQDQASVYGTYNRGV